MKPIRVALALTVAIGVGSLSAFGGDWNKQLAADYLDARQKAWFEWRAPKNDPGGPCVSCHTGITFLQARPALRAALHQTEPSVYEKGLHEAIANRLDNEKPGRMFPGHVKEPMASQAAGVDTVVSAFSMSIASSSSGEFTKALDRMLLTQIKEGDSRGGWAWFHLGESPWEAVESNFFGASLAAKALDVAPAAYRERQDVRERVADLESYLKREFASQPLHHRLFLIWVSSGIGNAVPAAARQETRDEALQKQQKDGSWTIASLGPWKSRGNVSDDDGSDCYATAIATLAMQRVNSPAAKRGTAWLRSHQDAASGAWPAKSMNKKFPPDSMMVNFMTEAATSYAVLALLETENL